MALISFKIDDHTPTGFVPSRGHVVFEPSHRHVHVDGGIGTLKPFTVPFFDDFTVNLETTGPNWAWKITVCTPEPFITAYYSVSGDTNFSALTTVDPETLEPNAEPEPAWWVMARSTVSGGVVDSDGNLILTRVDGSTVNAGHVAGAPGAPGVDGRDGVDGADGTDGLSIKGDQGLPGIDGTDGVDGADGTFNIGDTIRVEQPVIDLATDAVKIINSSTEAYALKIDQIGAEHDAVNIASLSGGGHTALGVVGSNETLSTVKVTNNAVQTSGVVIAGLGTDPSRTGAIFGAENSGSGSSFLSTMKAGGVGAAFQAVYDAVATYTSRILWLKGNHTAGDLVYVENGAAQTAGSVIKAVQTNALTTAPIVSISNAGTGSHIVAENFRVEKDGNVKATSLINFTSFNNAAIKAAVNGTTIDRNVADANPTLNVNNIHASSTGDIAQLKTGGVIKARVSKAGHITIRNTVAPLDADLIVGEVSLWFDATAGASKLMIKAKATGGAVVTGSIPLA